MELYEIYSFFLLVIQIVNIVSNSFSLSAFIWLFGLHTDAYGPSLSCFLVHEILSCLEVMSPECAVGDQARMQHVATSENRPTWCGQKTGWETKN